MKTNTNTYQIKSDIEVANIFQEYLHDYQRKYNLHPTHRKVVQDILNCRTAILGGHIEKCDECGTERITFNSCRNRHCPKCQTMAKEKWLKARKAELLPVSYFHNVFTLPHDINPVVLCNKKEIYSILFRSVSETLKQFGKDPRNRLKGDIGFISILHTWDQKLNDHFHLHCVIPGGALTFDKSRWVQCGSKYLFNVIALSMVYRGKFIHYLERAYEKGELKFPGKTEPLGTRSGFKKLIDQLWSKKWVVYSKKPFSGPTEVLDYIARYTHRVAISNHRIISLQDGRIKFTYKNRKKKTTEKITLSAVEFIRRFLLHVLPSRFMRIRSYGILANRYKKKNISICRQLLGLSPELPEPEEKTVHEMMLELTGADITLCPVCKKGKMKIIYEIPSIIGTNRYRNRKTITVEDST